MGITTDAHKLEFATKKTPLFHLQHKHRKTHVVVRMSIKAVIFLENLSLIYLLCIWSYLANVFQL